MLKVTCQMVEVLIRHVYLAFAAALVSYSSSSRKRTKHGKKRKKSRVFGF